eukprot:695505-Prorocentrum_minimum.AAC.2
MARVRLGIAGAGFGIAEAGGAGFGIAGVEFGIAGAGFRVARAGRAAFGIAGAGFGIVKRGLRTSGGGRVTLTGANFGVPVPAPVGGGGDKTAQPPGGGELEVSIGGVPCLESVRPVPELS